MENGLDSKKMEKIKGLLKDVYPLCRDAIIYYEVLTREMNYFGMSELRDAMEHIKRAFFAHTEDELNRDVESAFEHLRRGTTESLQKAATRSLGKAIDLAEIPNLGLRMALVEIPEKKLRELRSRAFMKLNEGRCLKSDKDTWIGALECFHDVIKTSFEIIDMYPSKAEIRFRTIQVLSFLVTIAALALAIWAYLN